jgi:cytoskeletal protein CcmA (bactofilin family)
MKAAALRGALSDRARAGRVHVVEGLVEGEVLARERVEVRATGRITAAVRTPSLVLEEGGSLEGRIEMTKKKPPASTPPEAASAA